MRLGNTPNVDKRSSLLNKGGLTRSKRDSLLGHSQNIDLRRNRIRIRIRFQKIEQE